MAIIEVNHVTKEFRLGQLHSLKQSALDAMARLRGQSVPERTPFKALDNVDFKVESGEVLGIIGQNGAGKSTLLKILAGISIPTHGSIKIQGTVAPLIEVGAGFVPDLTGRENIYLNATILGMRRVEIEKKFDEIVAFTELEKFIDTPIKRYSSGMQVRLGFSIATSVESKILIVDEVLAVGDLAFQRKCFDRMEDMIKRQGKTVLLVSHNIRQVERLCSRVILMDQGRAIADGNPTDGCNLFFDRSNAKIKETKERTQALKVRITEDMAAPEVQIFDEHGSATDRVECGRPMCIRLAFEVLRPLRDIGFLVGIHTSDFIYLTANNTGSAVTWDYAPGLHTVELKIEAMKLLPGVYSIRSWVGTPAGKVSFYGENLCTFQVYSDDHQITRQQEMGLFLLDGDWNIRAERAASSNL